MACPLRSSAVEGHKRSLSAGSGTKAGGMTILASRGAGKRVSSREAHGKVNEIDYLVVFLIAMTMAICAWMIQRTLSKG